MTEAQLTWVCRAEQLLDDDGRIVLEVGSREILVLAMDRRIFAIDNVCSHSVVLTLESGEVITESLEIRCLWHGGRFDLMTGEATRLPCRLPNRVYDVVVRDGDVWIRVPNDQSGVIC